MGNPPQSYGASLIMWGLLPSGECTRLNLSQMGQYSIYLPWRDGRLS